MRADAGVVPCKFLAWQRETAPQAASRPEGWFHATNLKNPKLQTKTTKPPGGKCFACCPAAFGIGRYLLVFFFYGVLAGFYGLFGGGFGAGGGFGQANAQ